MRKFTYATTTAAASRVEDVGLAQNSRALTNAMHGEDGAHVRRVATIANVQIEIAEDNPFVDFVQRQAVGVNTHQKATSKADQVFFDAIVAADEKRDKAVSKALHDEGRAKAKATFERNKPDGISQEAYQELIDKAAKERREKSPTPQMDRRMKQPKRARHGRVP